MNISNQDLINLKKSLKAIDSYNRIKKNRLIIYIIPLCWIAYSVLNYQLKPNWWHCIQLFLWLGLILSAIITVVVRRNAYLDSVVIMEELKAKYGVDEISELSQRCLAEETNI